MKSKIMLLLIITALIIPSVFAEVDVITPGPLELTGNPGDTLETTISVENIADTQKQVGFTNYQLVLDDYFVEIDSIDPISIGAGETEDVTISIPIDANQYAGTYIGKLKVEDDESFDEVEVKATVNAKSDLRSTTPAATISQGESGSATLTLTNIGNTDLNNVEIAVNDLTGSSGTISSTYINAPDHVSVNYGEDQPVTVMISISENQPDGTYTGNLDFKFGDETLSTVLTVKVTEKVHKITIEGGKLGSDDQEREEDVTETITIKNTGDYTENIVLSLEEFSDKYSAELDEYEFTLAPDEKNEVVLSTYVPDDQDSGVKKIGKLRASYHDTHELKTIELETWSALEIRTVDVTVDGSKDSSLKDGETVSKEAKPQDEVDIEVKIKNIFSRDNDLDIDDIEIQLDILGIDDGDDITEESDEFSLSRGDSEEITFNFEVPIEAEDDTFDVVIEVTGFDENDAKHTTTMTISLEVEKEKYDVRILSDTQLIPARAKCGQIVTLKTGLQNFGSRDEKRARISISSIDLGVDFEEYDIELDSDHDDDDNVYRKTLTIDTKGIAPGAYKINIFAYYAITKLAERDVVELTIDECTSGNEEEEEEEEQEDDETDVIIVPDHPGNETNEEENNDETVPVIVEGDSFFDNGFMMVLLIVANLGVVVLIVFLIVKYLF